MIQLDHIIIAANTLSAGVAYVEDKLKLAIPFGGKHAFMATHNHVLRLGTNIYLEIIANDPDVTPPGRKRWFNLDNPTFRAVLEKSPRLFHWVANTSDIEAVTEKFSTHSGIIVAAQRGNLNWKITIPKDGTVYCDGAFPTFIEWPRGTHPTQNMPDLGCELRALQISHPNAVNIHKELLPVFSDARVTFEQSQEPRISALIRTPSGETIIS